MGAIIDENMLCSIFSLAMKPVPSLQTSSMCDKLLAALLHPIDSTDADSKHLLLVQEAASFLKPARESSALFSTMAVNELPINVFYSWFPEYGAAVLGVSNSLSCLEFGSIRFFVVGLDEWRFAMHQGEHGFDHFANSLGYVVLSARLVGPDFTYAQVMKCFANELSKIQRSVSGGHQGHQKTPAFILALLNDCIQKVISGKEKIEVSSLPKGGLTDVGLHTGGVARDTSWSLVCSTLEVVATSTQIVGFCSSDAFKFGIVEFEAQLLRK